MSGCDQYRDDLEQWALDARHLLESDAIRAHIASCPTCRSEVHSIREAWSAMTDELTPIEASQDLETRVMERVLGDTPQVEVAHPLAKYQYLRYPLAAAVLVGLVFVGLRVGRGHVQQTERLVQQELVRVRQELLSRNIFQGESTTADIRFVKIRELDTERQVSACLSYDRETKERNLFALNLKAFETDTTYKVWFSDDQGTVIASSVVVVSRDDSGRVRMSLPDEFEEIQEMTITREDDPETTTPSNDIQLRARIESPIR